jgi:hypothetical protein
MGAAKGKRVSEAEIYPNETRQSPFRALGRTPLWRSCDPSDHVSLLHNVVGLSEDRQGPVAGETTTHCDFSTMIPAIKATLRTVATSLAIRSFSLLRQATSCDRRAALVGWLIKHGSNPFASARGRAIRQK